MTHEERFDRIGASLARVDVSVAGIDASTERLSQILMEFREDTARRFRVIDNRLSILTATVANVEIRFAELEKAILEFGKIAEQITSGQACA
jgi:hypothetical protein